MVSNWLVGRRIVEQEQHGRERAEYGKRIIELALEALTAELGKGYSLNQIKNFKKFYLLFTNVFLNLSVSVVAKILINLYESGFCGNFA